MIMNRMRYIYLFATLLAVLLATGCAEDDWQAEEVIPDGYGRLAITICTPEAAQTRGVVSPYWLEGEPEERAINSYVILICDGNNILQALSPTTGATLASHDATNNHFLTTTAIRSELMSIGTYNNLTFYCLANFTEAMLGQAGLTFSEGIITNTSLPSGFEAKAIQISNSKEVPTGGIPMTGKLTASVTINSGTITTQDNSNPKKNLVITLWRMMAKLQLDFVNESGQQMDILGIEIDPLNDGTVGTPLWQTFKGSSTLDLTSLSNDSHGDIDVVSGVVNGPWSCKSLSDDDPPVEQILASVPAKNGSTNGTATFTAYINETDATYTTVENQFSLRFKVKRIGRNPQTNEVTTEVTEYRYAVTSPYVTGQSDGFNVIRRNDWIHLPIHFTDWQFQVEALPFPPIAGFQARMVTADAQSITFNTGGYIVLHPLFRKITDSEGAWRTFDDADITCTLPNEESDYDSSTLTTTYAKAIATTGTGIGTGIEIKGNLSIFDQRFVQLPSGDIVGKLTNDAVYGTVTIVLHVMLDGFHYQFSYNIVKV